MVVMMMLMYNQDYDVNDLIEFDQMDVDENEDDEIHLEMVEENKEVENQLYQNLMIQELMMMMMIEYLFDLELLNHLKNYLIDPIELSGIIL
jgi:hypothetical protein